MGWPGIFLGYEHRADYLCSGIFLIKNNDIGKRLMRDWMYGAEDFSDQERKFTEILEYTSLRTNTLCAVECFRDTIMYPVYTRLENFNIILRELSDTYGVNFKRTEFHL
ncbi:hypothetical protein BCR33DRAFT_316781 [Rhizoclosmatium globosum]|uniref:Uncharacterized protein n=1 Tax=Rhizoclosmatium globosum TaxID=329046 RepID=A0A1Y2D1A6_9FUNG|nr:hypothetical protein BCR33DRAFT_316781 [Rhizoclosmatium globosum]|eukprot:ORY52385.1 hypothetical protein BCR33DRAFT_316781 [Rhizoclosmatium globosum]